MSDVASSQPSIIARRIKEIRLAKGWSRQQLADELETTYLQIYRIEKGITEVSADALPGFADALGVPVASLYRESRAS